MYCFRPAAKLSWCVLLGSIAPALAQGQITYTANSTLWRILAQPGAVAENLSTKLNAIARFPGGHSGPVAVSRDGAWYVFRSERFAADCQGDAGLTVAPASFASAQTIQNNGASLHGEGLAAITSGGTAVVFEDGGGPHTRDLYVVRRSGSGWSAPQLLTGASTFTYNYWPSLSPDGTKVVFDMGPTSFPSTAIGEVRLDGTGFRVVITENSGPTGTTSGSKVEAHSPSYAPDGSIVFEAQWSSDTTLAQGVERVWRLPAAGGTPVLVSPGGNDNSPVVLPDGRIASLVLPASTHQIKVMGATGQNPFVLTPSSLEVDDIGLSAGANPPGTVTPTPTPAPTPTPTPTGLAISGRITSATGLALANVRLMRSGSTVAATSDRNGNFSLSGVVAGTYTVTPALTGFAFNPPNATVTVRTTGVTNVLFIGVQPPYIIGRVTSPTAAGQTPVGLAGVAVLRTNSTGFHTDAFTNAAGYYGFSAVPAGTYTMTAGKVQTTFLPPSIRVTLSSTVRAATASFTGLAAPSISGRAYNSANAGIAGVVVTRRNSAGVGATATTDINGYYGFSGVLPGTYTLTARRSGFTFQPISRTVTVTSTTGTFSLYFLGAPAPVALTASSATAASTTSSVRLAFATALDAESASNPDHYQVTVNGVAQLTDSVAYDAATRSVTLDLPPGSFARGASIIVVFNLNDLAGTPRTGRTGPIAAS